MNYIWDMLIQAEKIGIEMGDITFVPAKVYSPYMELSFADLNCLLDEVDPKIEVNPYYRFYGIFKEMFLPDIEEYYGLRRVLFDLIFHHLAEIDFYTGMNRQEFYKIFLGEEIGDGCFGEEIKRLWGEIEDSGQQAILDGALQLFQTGESLVLFGNILCGLFPGSSMYQNRLEKEEVLIYLGRKKDAIEERLITMIVHLFLPFQYTYRVYWESHFGIIGEEGTMGIGHIQLY